MSIKVLKYSFGIIFFNLKNNLYFRESALFNVCNFLIIFIIKSSLWSKVGDENFINYFAIITIISSFTFSESDRFLQEEYQSGNIIFYMLKPMNFGLLCFIKDLALNVSNFMLRTLPLIIILVFFFDVKLMYSWLNIIFWIISILFAMLFNWMVSYLTGLSVFFFKNNEGIIQFRNILFGVLSGSIIPIYFFPESCKGILDYLPFRVVYQIPIEILGNTHNNSISLIFFQLIWILLGFLLIFNIQNFYITKTEIMGG